MFSYFCDFPYQRYTLLWLKYILVYIKKFFFLLLYFETGMGKIYEELHLMLIISGIILHRNNSTAYKYLRCNFRINILHCHICRTTHPFVYNVYTLICMHIHVHFASFSHFLLFTSLGS